MIMELVMVTLQLLLCSETVETELSWFEELLTVFFSICAKHTYSRPGHMMLVVHCTPDYWSHLTSQTRLTALSYSKVTLVQPLVYYCFFCLFVFLHFKM